jgi:hypothetical protein
MKKWSFLFIAFALLGFTGCLKDVDNYIKEKPLLNDNEEKSFELGYKKESFKFYYDFASGMQGWQGDFADYPVGEETLYELKYEHSPLPGPLDQNQNALKQSGNNHSDDLFMFIKRKITGLIPNQTYKATFDIQIATDAASNTVGIGGAPGEGVSIKAGITPKEPEKEIKNGDYRMNIDKGNQVYGGADMAVIGDFANGTDEFIYVLKNLSNEDPFQIQADENGDAWAIIGTDSGFEGTTTIYYNKISIKLE